MAEDELEGAVFESDREAGKVPKEKQPEKAGVPEVKTEEPANAPATPEPTKAEGDGVDGREPAKPGEGDVPPQEPDKGNVYNQPGHTPKGVQDRINGLTRKVHEQDAELAELRKFKADYEKAQQPTREPTKEDFIKAGKTEDDYINYLVEKRTREGVEKALEQQRANDAALSDYKSLKSDEDEARKLFDDYDSVVYSDENLNVFQETKDYLVRGNREGEPKGVECVYMLLKFPALKEAFSKCANSAQEIGFLEGLKKRLGELKKQAFEKKQPSAAATQQPAAQEPPKAEPPQQKQNQFREPRDNKSASTGKAPNWATASIEELEGYFG